MARPLNIAEMLKVCNNDNMTKIININARGTLTLPKEARLELGLSGAGQVVVESTGDGLLLRPGVTFPIEIYSKGTGGGTGEERCAARALRGANQSGLAR